MLKNENFITEKKEDKNMSKFEEIKEVNDMDEVNMKEEVTKSTNQSKEENVMSDITQETVKVDLIKYYFDSSLEYYDKVDKLPFGVVVDKLERCIEKGQDIHECISKGFDKKFIFDNMILNQPVLEHLHVGSTNYFILQDNGIEKFGTTNKNTNSILVIIIDTEDSFVDVGVYDRLGMSNRTRLEPVECSSVNKVSDIIFMLEKYTDLFDYPVLV